MKTPDHSISNANREEKASLFWNWFSQNRNIFLASNEITTAEIAKFLEQLSIELDKYNPNLFFEIGKKPGDHKMQFVVTAAGNVDYFNEVELLCSKAPVFEKWEIIAFKPPIGTHFKLRYRGVELNPESIIFIPLDNTEVPESVGLHVCFDDLNDRNREILIGGTYLILDSIIGEKATALDIDYMDIIKTPADIDNYDFKYLNEIATFIEEKKVRIKK